MPVWSTFRPTTLLVSLQGQVGKVYDEKIFSLFSRFLPDAISFFASKILDFSLGLHIRSYICNVNSYVKWLMISLSMMCSTYCVFTWTQDVDKFCSNYLCIASNFLKTVEEGTDCHWVKGHGTVGRQIALILKGNTATRRSTEGNCRQCRRLSRGLLDPIRSNRLLADCRSSATSNAAWF